MILDMDNKSEHIIAQTRSAATSPVHIHVAAFGRELGE